MTTDPALSSSTGTGPLPGGPGTDDPLLPGSEPVPAMPEPPPVDPPVPDDQPV